MNIIKYAQLDLEKPIMNYSKRLNLNLQGKKINECIDIIIKECPQLYSKEDIQEYCNVLTIISMGYFIFHEFK